MRTAEVVDVACRVVDLLDLQRVDDSPSFSISVPELARVSWVSFSRSRMRSSMVSWPTMARRVAGEDVVHRVSIWSCWSRNRRPRSR